MGDSFDVRIRIHLPAFGENTAENCVSCLGVHTGSLMDWVSSKVYECLDI